MSGCNISRDCLDALTMTSTWQHMRRAWGPTDLRTQLRGRLQPSHFWFICACPFHRATSSNSMIDLVFTMATQCTVIFTLVSQWLAASCMPQWVCPSGLPQQYSCSLCQLCRQDTRGNSTWQPGLTLCSLDTSCLLI